MNDSFTIIDYHKERDFGQKNIQYLSVILAKSLVEDKKDLLVDINQKGNSTDNDLIQNLAVKIPFGKLQHRINTLDKERTMIITSASDVKIRRLIA